MFVYWYEEPGAVHDEAVITLPERVLSSQTRLKICVPSLLHHYKQTFVDHYFGGAPPPPPPP